VEKSHAAITSLWLLRNASHCFAFARVASALQPLEVARNRRFGNLESKPEQFAMNARRAPGWIIGLHTADQFANFFL